MTNFTLYRITLHNSPMFHVKLAARGFTVWGVTIKTPSTATNSVGTALNANVAHNTDGIDPGEAASNGFIVCSKISVGDDHIAIKGATGVTNLTIAHNHFRAGHGMSIGSEINGGVSGLNVYDLSIDGLGSGLGGGSSNGIRIKSDPSRGGLVTNANYTDICTRNLANPIILTPMYSALTGTLIPTYNGITIRNFRSVASTVVPTVTLLGFDTAHLTGVTLDNVVIDGVTAARASAQQRQRHARSGQRELHARRHRRDRHQQHLGHVDAESLRRGSIPDVLRSASLRYFCGPMPNFFSQRQTAARCLPSSRDTSATLPS